MFLLLVFILGCIYITGSGDMPGIYSQLFEYKDGFWDLSNAEFGYLLLYAGVLYRHAGYCKKYNAGIWVTVSKPIFYLGYLALVGFILIGVIVVAAIYTGHSSLKLNRADMFATLDGIEQFLMFLLSFLAIYLSTPTSEFKRITNTESSESKNDSENVIYAGYQE
jgi:hypothetical protein